nr:hypothetical protein [Tanacetum cinerariifolium]
MSSPNHPTSDIEDNFSSNFPDYIPASPDYVPASPGKTYSSSSNNSFGLVPIASPTLILFLEECLPPKKQGRDRSSSSIPTLSQEFEIGESSRKTDHKKECLGKGRVIIQQDFDNLETKLQETRAQVAKLQRKQLGQTNKIALARFRIVDLEQIIKEIQARHQADKESLLDAIYEL